MFETPISTGKSEREIANWETKLLVIFDKQSAI